MPVLIRNGTLAKLRRQAASAEAPAAEARQAGQEMAGCRRRAKLAEDQAAEAGRRAARAEAVRDELQRSIVGKLTHIRDEALHPDRGEEVRGALALRIVRDWIASAAAETDGEITGQVRILNALLSPADGVGAEQQPAEMQSGAEAQ